MPIRSRPLTYPLTYNDLERARDASNERLELIEGELFVTPAPSPMHQDVSGYLNDLFRRVILAPGRGRVYYAPLDVRLTERTFVQPDLVIILADRRSVLTAAGIDGAPSLVVEIASPATSAYDRVTKRDLYARHGVPEYWFVDPDGRTVTVFSDAQDGRYQQETTFGDIAVSATIPELSVNLSALFDSVPEL